MKYGVSYKENPQEYRKRQSLATRVADPMLNSFRCAKSRAKKRGLEFDIDYKDFEMPTHCPVFGIPLIPSRKYRTDNSPSWDRIDNSKGYVKGNVRIISFLANCRKGDLTIEQVESLLNYMKGTST